MKEQEQQRAPMVILDEFLVAQEWASLLDYTLARAADFEKSGVVDAGGAHRADSSYRRSEVLYDLGEAQPMFVDRILTFLPHVLARLRRPPFPISHFEVQLTATNDGQFFRKHRDNDAVPVRSRVLTFVYYFFREPRAFRGGALRLYDMERDARGQLKPGAFVHPSQNQIVFFPSHCLHEVLPVECASRVFSDSRFTVNGWVHQ
jgi:Rps23 Pro-64 3,4-dihydroxylase Tpa1-like proline 4-hydroxylase